MWQRLHQFHLQDSHLYATLDFLCLLSVQIDLHLKFTSGNLPWHKIRCILMVGLHLEQLHSRSCSLYQLFKRTFTKSIAWSLGVDYLCACTISVLSWKRNAKLVQQNCTFFFSLRRDTYIFDGVCPDPQGKFSV